ncbi:hypothetical protein [Nocardia amikacinitolerans]|uniref:hypothetical protein n=1 Tax=Nocardia amikacinitolerans TaxID=756689 RepID=UPI0020A46821|nr:hypothetical protein [Nocardia amikacinitolerans]MCP2289634.1 hypothetical protein [Nocardia amikacinitolerans]
MNPHPRPQMTRAEQELGERAPLDEAGAHRDIATVAGTWLLYCWHLIAGALAGLAMFALCVLALVEVLYFWAIPMGALLALAIWAATATISTIRMRRRGRNATTIRFLVGFGIIPCYFGSGAIISACLDGWVNPMIG